MEQQPRCEHCDALMLNGKCTIDGDFNDGEQAELARVVMAERIRVACETTKPRTKARNKALAAIKWVLRDQFGNYAALDDEASIKYVEDIRDAIVFDGRDNEEYKKAFYGAMTGLNYEVVLA